MGSFQKSLCILLNNSEVGFESSPKNKLISKLVWMSASTKTFLTIFLVHCPNMWWMGFWTVFGCFLGARQSYLLDRKNFVCIFESTVLTGLLYAVVAWAPFSCMALMGILRFLKRRVFTCLPHIQVSQQAYDISIGYHLVLDDPAALGEKQQKVSMSREINYHCAVRAAELEYGLSSIAHSCTVNVQGFLLDPNYEQIIFVLPNQDAARMRRSSPTLYEQLDSVNLPRIYQGYSTSFVSLQEYDNPDLLQNRQTHK